MLSGNQLTAAQQYGQNYAMQNAWNPYVSQLNTLAQNGQNAGASLGTIGATTGNSVANTQLAAGQAAASGIVGSANAITGGINTGIYSGLNLSLIHICACRLVGIGRRGGAWCNLKRRRVFG